MLAVAVAIKLDSRGPVFFGCERVGFRGRGFSMLKFRKMHDGASGPALTSAEDARFTRVGRWLARSKIDELPQLWNVLRGEMSLVGPRPEHRSFVRLRADDFAEILSVRPGITGLSQLAFAREAEVLDPADNVGHYVRRVLPQKICLDRLYARTRTPVMDVKILLWTTVAVVLGADVAVDRRTGRLGYRRRKAARPTQAEAAGKP
jgi:lipopolysaccharide/colanic/teichoic acid biosynthesis glycosyltransferase